MKEARRLVRERVRTLPQSVKDCSQCSGSRKIRRSSLRPEPCADDVMLKCTSCYNVATHGIPIDRETYEKELDMRPNRVLDFVYQGPSDVQENLEALGYIDL